MSVHAASIPNTELVEPVARFTKPAVPLRILLVTAQYLPHVGGTEIHTYEVARRLVAAGNQVTVLTTALEGNLPGDEEVAGVSVHRVRAWPSGRDYFFAPGLYHFIRHGHWDVIHCLGYHTLVAPLTMLAAWQSKCPYIVTFHSGGHSSWLRKSLRPLQRMLLRPLLARADRLVAVSKWEAEFFREKLRIPPERFSVIPNGAYLPVGATPLPNARNSTLIVSVGRLERYKGHHRVIASLPLLIEQYPI